MATTRVRPLSQELGGVDLGDPRLNRRLMRIADAVALSPSMGLPKALRTEAALEATYRFLSNPRVQPKMILEPHLEATCERLEGEPMVLAIHDTTEFAFGGESRASVGRTNNSQPGFFAHVALAVRATDREPLGLLDVKTWARRTPATPKAKRRTRQYRMREDKESNRWAELVETAEERVAGRASLIHVMDREGDQYRLFDAMIRKNARFVIRARHDRLLASGSETLRDALARASVVLEREVALSSRRPKHKRSAHHPRTGRIAQLHVAAMKLEIKRSKGGYNSGASETLTVNAVNVLEVSAKDGEDPVEWILLTNLPVDTVEQVAFVVDCYRGRWVIEELFKAVKTGCAYEKLQLESGHALMNALAIILPIAWQMLLLRSLARAPDDVPATKVLTQSQLDVLRATPWTTLPRRPTAKDALRAIATLGGHIRNNGEPGWQVMYRGFRDLMLLEIGWRARSDQS